MYSRRAFGQLLAGLPLSLALFRKNSRVAVLPKGIRLGSVLSLGSEDSLRHESTIASQGEIMSNWSLTSPYGIQMDDAGQVWHSGYVRDTLQLDSDTIVVAADRGGVWRVTNAGDAVPMSDRWDNPDVFCLALGQSGPRHVFAGTSYDKTGKGALWMTDPRAPDPLQAWNKISIPNAAGSVMHILVLRRTSRVVLATQSGLWWSPFPPTTNPFDYRWTQVTSGIPIQGVDAWHQISEGPNETVVAAIERTGLFFGSWVSGALQMQSATLPSDMSGSQLNRTSIASGASNRRSLFAVSGDGNISFLLSSVDGGRSWQHLNTQVIGQSPGTTVLPQAGNMGWHNQCLAVSPTDTRVIALGWRYGPFVSKDSGRTWQRFNNEVIAELHVDVQSVRFSADGRKLFIGTDGGVAVADVTLGPPTSPFLQNFTSVMNKHLATLQFAGWPSRVVWGTLSVNSQFAAGGVQDNGNLWCRWRDRSPWRGWGADGQMTLMITDTDLVYDNAAADYLPILASWDGSRMIVKGRVPVMDPNRRIVPNAWPDIVDPNAVRGLGTPRELFASTITVPGLASVRNANFRIHAVAGVDHKVFGLFGDEKPTGYHWEPLGNIPRAAGDFITALGSYDGVAILVGTNLGRIFRLNPRVSRVEMTPRNVGMVTRLLVDASAPPALRGFAHAGNTILQLVGGSITAHQGSWNVLGPVTTADERIWDLAVDWTSEPPRLFAATDEKVYTSLDGRQWEIVSRGLPDVPHCAALQVADGHLFLGTFGRSMWHASLLKSWSNEEDLGGDLTSAPAACTWGPGRLDVFYRGGNNRLWHRWFAGGRWNAAEDLRGVLTDSPTACTWGPGRLDTFYRGQNNHLWHRWFDGVWHDEEDLGGVLTSAPAACTWGPGRIDVFYRGENNRLWHRWFDGVWHDAEDLRGGLTSAPTACTWGPGRLDVFYRGGNNRLWHRWFDGVWHDEEDLRGGLTSAPAACAWGPGRLDVFYRGGNNRLWHRSFDSVWHDEEDLRGVLTEVPTACTWGPRRLDAFYRGQNNHLWHRWFPV